MPYNGTDNAQTHTITFDVLGIETQQPKTGVVFSVSTTGPITVKFIGSQPSVICAQCSFSYAGATETITYAGGKTDTLTVIWLSTLVTKTESQSVLFRDDFLYTNPLLESSWTIDQYTQPGTNPGEYTSSGYLIMKGSMNVETVHVTNPMYQPSAYTTGTAVKRKMTAALIPFSKLENPATANIRIGFAPLLTSGTYPGSAPYGTPSVDNLGFCGGVNPIGTAYVFFDNSGSVATGACGDGAVSGPTLESGLNPSLYTVFTIETYGIFCSTCADNAYVGSTWVFFRVYQEDSTGTVLSATDKNLNVTSGVAPLFQTTYSFISQQNGNLGNQISKIDFVQVQNYGSPVCLVAPAGFLCSRLPTVPNGIIGNNGLVGLIAWLANQIGFGDEQIGALILFLAMFFGAAFIPYFFSKNLPVGAFGAMLTLGFFTYVGFLPIWTLILVFMGGAAIVVMLVFRMLGGTSIGSLGGEE
jgi:hypothetical protein